MLNTIENTLFVGKVLLNYPKLASTNQTAKEYIAKNTPIEGTVINTYHQHSGKGQIDSSWESEPDKNISLSVILSPSFLKNHQQFLLSQTVALGVYDFLANHIGHGLSIKWPNDIYVGDQKIAGILIQNTIMRGHLQDAIIGIGININQTVFNHAPNPVSLSQITGKTHQLDQCVIELCQALDLRYSQLKKYYFRTIENYYLRYLYRYQQASQFQQTSNGNIFSGVIVGTTPHGLLRIETVRGIKEFDLKEVKFI